MVKYLQINFCQFFQKQRQEEQKEKEEKGHRKTFGVVLKRKWVDKSDYFFSKLLVSGWALMISLRMTSFKGAAKSYFMHSCRVVIILFNTDLLLFKASCINNIHTGENDFFFCSCYFWRFVSRFFSDSKKLVVYFGLCESFLVFQRREDQIKIICKK